MVIFKPILNEEITVSNIASDLNAGPESVGRIDEALVMVNLF